MRYLFTTTLLMLFAQSPVGFASSLCPASTPGTPAAVSPNPLPTAETPASIACIYGLTANVPGCPIKGTTLNPTGGWGAIAVIEGGDDPNAYAELTAFSLQYNLPVLLPCPANPTAANVPCFGTYYVNNVKPKGAVDITEHVIDIEWAHAMAPWASIYMVEGADLCVPGVFATVDLASQMVANTGGGLVSNSWSVSEFSTEAGYDFHFQMPSVVYVGSSGDYSYPARYPSASPYVVSAGATLITRNAAGQFVSESAWRDTYFAIGQKLSGVSGGPSMYEPRPSYQDSVAKIVGTHRGTPDISFVGDPVTGMSVYKTLCTDVTNNTGCSSGWVKVGGTSLSAPALAGIINSANGRAQSSMQELTTIYTAAIKNYATYWHDVTQGNNGYPALRGYDFTTGLGTPSGYAGK